MWILDHTMLEIVFRSAIIYVVVLVGIRLTGKREVGQMSTFDLVLLLLIANAVQNAMTGPDTSVTGGFVAAATLLALNKLIGYAVWRNKTVRKIVEGSPTMLVHNGVVLSDNLARESITREELQQAMREHGIVNLNDVYLAVLEVDGSVSVLKKGEVKSSTAPHRRFRFLSKKTS